MDSQTKPRRVSVFQEVGLFDDEPCTPIPESLLQAPTAEQKTLHYARAPSVGSIREEEEELEEEEMEEEEDDKIEASETDVYDENEYERLLSQRLFSILPIVEPTSCNTRFDMLFTQNVVIISFILLLIHASLASTPGRAIALFVNGASLDPIHTYQKRATSPTDVCKRWSQQSALVNGTLYLYGGRATTSPSQESDTWNNNLLTLDLKKSWQISDPPLTGLEQPSGPPAVANGYLWHSYDSLFLYGGEYSDTPAAKPDTFALWDYSIKSSSWKQHSDAKSEEGINSEPEGQTIQRAAEGAGFSVPSLGRAWYFGGHLDAYTSPTWSLQTARLYLKSFVEFTFPGYSNPAVSSLSNNQTAGSEGAWRNITNAGIQDTNGFTERADGILTYIPGFSESGMLISLAGGTNETFTQMNVVDVYDIANSTWYRQSTSGPTPEIRVNPCAVVAAAADGSSYQVYMFGGQNLIPYGSQIQYSDMWILTIPSFTWIQVNTTTQSTPYPRAGHTCDIWDSQMVVVGGYISKDISCETPGIYIFNLSSLEWSQSFNTLPGGGSDATNPFSQQLEQRGADKKSGLHGSYGYAVPKQVYEVIGGSPTGGATVTAPVNLPTAGPLATGKPITYTLTGPAGGQITTTGVSSASNGDSSGGTNVGAAVAGSVAGVLAILAGYLAFCALLYRKQLAIYKSHDALTNEHASTIYSHGGGEDAPAPAATRGGRISNFFFGTGAAYQAQHAHKESTEGSGGEGGSGSGHNSGIYNVYTHETGYGPGHRPSSGDMAWGHGGHGTPNGSQEDLNDISGWEPSYWGVLLHPRQSLRVINR